MATTNIQFPHAESKAGRLAILQTELNGALDDLDEHLEEVCKIRAFIKKCVAKIQALEGEDK